MKTYAYLRISTDKQTFDQQLNTINNYLKLKGLSIDETFSDEGVSGGVSYKERKLNDLLNEMNEGDVLVVSEISRLGRSMSDLNKLINDEMKPRKLRLIIISMGLDLDCANIKAIDEMVLFAFSFSAQIEKELIQERTKSALEARKKMIAEQGYFISKKGNRCTRLGNNGVVDNSAAVSAASKARNERAKNDPSNRFFWQFCLNWSKKNGGINSKTNWQSICDELNSLGQKTTTGLEFTKVRARSLYKSLERVYSNN